MLRAGSKLSKPWTVAEVASKVESEPTLTRDGDEFFDHYRRAVESLSDTKGTLADVKGDAYEGLLEKNAQDIKNGAGQYFTPRADCGNGGLHRARARRDDLRPRLRHRRLSVCPRMLLIFLD
jgi:N-6 DNA Methylase